MEEDPAIIAIPQLLTGVGASALIAEKLGNRIYPVQAPDSTPPGYLTFSQLGAEVITTKDGDIPNGWSFDISIFTTNVLDAKRIAREVIRTLSNQVTAVEGLGNLRLSYVDEIDTGYDETRELFTIGLEFRAKKTT